MLDGVVDGQNDDDCSTRVVYFDVVLEVISIPLVPVREWIWTDSKKLGSQQRNDPIGRQVQIQIQQNTG